MMKQWTTSVQTAKFLEPLRKAMASANRCLLVAEPGAGKTTRAPLALLQDTDPDRGRWLLLEPRRVAVRLAASYMAAQLGEKPGETVGYRVRGEQRVGPGTRLEVITQGIFTRMLQDDPTLDGIAGVIFDEFHERSLEADLGLALVLDVQDSLREDLRLLVMSATLDVPALQSVLGKNTALIDVPGRHWPVDTYYRSPSLREEPAAHQARVIREVLVAHEGHMLVFLPGQREIRRLHRELESLPYAEVCPLHGQLTLAQQQAVLRPPDDGQRRIILSTAIAESSLTVPGVRIVIDAGQERIPRFDPRTGMTRLHTRRVNRASADQRRGRAGREAAGHCYRLCSEETVLQHHREPEILQADLSGLLFELIRWGEADPVQLPWVDPPPAAALSSARELLLRLGLLEDNGALSTLGQRCTRWPTHPRLAVLLETAEELDALPLACWLVAWLEENPPGRESDLYRILEQAVQQPRQAEHRWRQAAQQWASRVGSALKVDSLDGLESLLVSAFPDRIAQNMGQGQFRLVGGNRAILPETDALNKADYLVALSLDGQRSGARIFQAVATRAAVLEQRIESCQQWRPQVQWDEHSGSLSAEEVRGIGAVILENRPLATLPAEAICGALLQALRKRGAFRWSEEDRQLLGRLQLLHNTLDAPWPDVRDAALLFELEDWLAPRLDGVQRLDALDRLPLARYRLEALDWSLQRDLDYLAPTHLTVPSGSRLRIDYQGEEPVLAVKLQEMFGQTETPRIVDGKVSLVIHLLSPARRPVQVTRDLAGFWSGSYFEVRKDLRGRYPKHPWPEDPLQAEATRHTKRKSR